MKYHYLLTGILLFFLSCKQEKSIQEIPFEKPTIASLIQNLENSEAKEVIVVAHRGDWRNAPENSLQAIQNCIELGVDMVEIDVQETKDGHLVLMHDKTINRTTTGEGRVKDFTLDSLKTFQLLDGLGIPTSNTIPTLEEALLVAKDKILVNLDKSYPIFDKCYEIIKSTNTNHQVLIKGGKTRTEVENEFGDYLDKVYFMPIIWLTNPKAQEIVDDYLENRTPIAFEFIFPQDSAKLIKNFGDIRQKGASIWVNSLWAPLNGGHNDEKAAIDPDIYEWYLENDVNIIQTDRPKLLIEYLRSKGYHR